jgi:predicted dithiol-disulfide oxidoreductase (DUF899 family)
MDTQRIVSQEEWLAERKELLAKEKELTRAKDEVAASLRRLPMVEIDKKYVFQGTNGPVELVDLFDRRRQLIVYHFMFDPEWDAGCSSCSFLTDNIGDLSHVNARDTTLVLVSRAPLAKLESYRKRMGWTVPWYSSHGSDFNQDFHVTADETVKNPVYNYVETPGRTGEAHGLSVFLREGERVFHTYSTYARGLDNFIGTYHYLDVTPLGRQEEKGRTMSWVRRHDEYVNA